MPVTILLPNEPKSCPKSEPEKSGLALLEKACPKYASNAHRDIKVWEGTWKDLKEGDNIAATSDSFVRSALEAYAQHMHLVLRPEEVWFAILTQMNFYMARNAEDVRHLFVGHQGQQDIKIEELDFRHMLSTFASIIQKRVKTPWLRNWILPDFSTTTAGDLLTANCLMMGLMQKYFRFYNAVTCGIPSVTLLGELSDWEKLVEKLDKMEYFGKEPADYAHTLRIILKHFVLSFIEPDSSETKEFWNSMVKVYRGDDCAGPAVDLDGWIMDFFKWDEEGCPITVKENPMARSSKDADAYPMKQRSIDIFTLPIGYVEVPVTFIDDTIPYKLALVAGGMAKRIDIGAPKSYYEALGRPVPGDDKDLPTYASKNWPRDNIDVENTSTPSAGCFGGLFQRFRRRQARISGSLAAISNKPKSAVMRKKVKVVKEFTLKIEEIQSEHDSDSVKAMNPDRTPIWQEFCPEQDNAGIINEVPMGARNADSVTIRSSQLDPMEQDDHTTLVCDESRVSLATDGPLGGEDSSMLSYSGYTRHPSEVQLVKVDGPDGEKHTTIQPLSGWMLFGNKQNTELEQSDDAKMENLLLERALYTSMRMDLKEKAEEEAKKKAQRVMRDRRHSAIVIAVTR